MYEEFKFAREEVRTADQKAGHLLTAVGLLAAVGLATVTTAPDQGWPRWLLVAALVCAFSAMLLLLAALRPKTPRVIGPHRYFRYYASLKTDADRFLADMPTLVEDRRQATMILAAARLAAFKYRLIRVAVALIQLSVVIAVVSLALYAIRG
ncbi:hypothetical protein GCM10023263_79580 [Phytohabitans rumicis]